MVNWGLRSPFAGERGIPLVSSVRIDHARNGPYFKTMFRTGRAVVPVDGWYEWTGGVQNGQPWHIRRVSREPFFLAAIGSYRAHNIVADGTGFVIVCAVEGGGLIDPRNQRPIALSRMGALQWIDHSLSVEQAAEVACSYSIGAEEFEYFPVGQAVNRLGSNGSQLLIPISACLDA